jgi:hypothetical protein
MLDQLFARVRTCPYRFAGAGVSLGVNKKIVEVQYGIFPLEAERPLIAHPSRFFLRAECTNVELLVIYHKPRVPRHAAIQPVMRPYTYEVTFRTFSVALISEVLVPSCQS